MAYGKEEQGDDNEFVHFEEELVIAERPDVAATPQSSPVARKGKSKKSPAKRGKKPAAKKARPAKKAKPVHKKAAKKKAGKKSGKRGKKR